MKSMKVRIVLAVAFLAAIASQALPAERMAAQDTTGIDKRTVRIHRTVERDAQDGPTLDQEYFIHTFVLDLVGVRPETRPSSSQQPPAGTPVYRVVQTSEGPYVGNEAWLRRAEIMKEGLLIGTHYWPLDRIQRVELRPEQ